MTDEQDRPVLNGSEPAPPRRHPRADARRHRLHPGEDREALVRTRVSDTDIVLSEEEVGRLIAEAAPEDAAPGLEGSCSGSEVVPHRARAKRAPSRPQRNTRA